MVNLIVALGGGDDRKKAAVLMYKQGYGEHILFTGEPNIAQIYSEFGVGAEGIYPVLTSTDTISDVAEVQDTMNRNHFTSAIIVDSNYHLPRTKLLFSRLFQYSASISFAGVNTPVTWKQQLNELAAYVIAYFTVKKLT